MKSTDAKHPKTIDAKRGKQITDTSTGKYDRRQARETCNRRRPSAGKI